MYLICLLYPCLQVLHINAQGIAAVPNMEDGITFSLPQGCELDELVVEGPEDTTHISVDGLDGNVAEGGVFVPTTLALVALDRCKVSAT